LSLLDVALVDAERAQKLLPMDELIESIGTAFEPELSLADRILLDTPDERWIVMSGRDDDAFMCKLLRFAHPDGASGRVDPAGVVVVLGPGGDLRAIVDAAALNARRTAAVAGFATRALARTGASVLALFGVGSLAEPQIEAIGAVRQLTDIRVVASRAEHAERFAARLRKRGLPVRAANARTALAGADIVVTATTSPEPVFDDGDLEPGTHINAMGAYQPDRRELPSRTVRRARLAVETRESAWSSAGELLLARAEGEIGDDHVVADLREPAAFATVRRDDAEVTIFKSLGHAAFDLAAVRVLSRNLARSEARA
jgi:ornithine cyclodeaminase/alanine dehydrogenase-like protein (mu-crystallin family)